MTGSTYNRETWQEIQSSFVSPFSQGVSGTALANSDTNFDITLSDDVFLRGVEFISQAAVMGDLVTIQVISPPSTVIATPVSNWNVLPGSNLLSYLSLTPKKLPASLTIRVIYHNAGNADIAVGINYNLLKILS